MQFDTKKFKSAKFIPREEDVPVPDMAEFFSEASGTESPGLAVSASPPVWRVRGLTGVELGRARAAAERNRNIANVMEALAGGVDKEKVKALREMIGLADKVPDDVATRLELLVIGSVAPVADMDLALQVCKAFPIEFYQLTNEINRLTGMGHTVGKSKPSGETRTSKTPSPSDTPGGECSTS